MSHGSSARMVVRPRFAIALRTAIVILAAGLLSPSDAAAQTVLSGLTTSFTKSNGADETLRANQDRIALGLLLARAGSGGIFNWAAGEEFFQSDSPANTEWATDINNPSDEKNPVTIAAVNYEALTFDPWVDAYGGFNVAGGNVAGRDAVLHLIPEDIYLDVRFTTWTTGAAGGGFTLQRSKTPDGDYNEDGVVDSADYTVWRDTLGQPVASLGDGADGDLSGMIDQGDYEFWIEVFGEVINTVDLPQGSAAAGDLPSGVATVPEPATLWLLCAAALAMGLAARLRA